MLPLFDTIAKAQGGHGIEALARQFSLSRAQTQAALDALLPAFSEGLKRQTADPWGMMSLFQNMASGRHAGYFDNAADPQAAAAGNDVLAQLFGSKDLSRAVAAQAAAATGIGQDVFKRMMPVVASMLMGGMSRQAMNGAGGPNNPLGEIIEGMMRAGTASGGMTGVWPGGQPLPREREPAANPYDNPWGKMLEGMFGNRDAAQPSPSPSATENPWEKMWRDWASGGQPPRQSAQPRQEAGERPSNPYDELFGQMFETGRQTRDDYQRGVQNIFDQFLKGMERHR
ncbi:MAG TPA: DUF937 domain-containing protein [Mesorhizobium sp.]|nr:DUF937 domain-containing protein [Mesorhizobium sp.]